MKVDPVQPSQPRPPLPPEEHKAPDYPDKPPPQAPDFSQIKFINYDFAKYGSSAERRRLLSKWDNEVKNLPK